MKRRKLPKVIVPTPAGEGDIPAEPVGVGDTQRLRAADMNGGYGAAMTPEPIQRDAGAARRVDTPPLDVVVSATTVAPPRRQVDVERRRSLALKIVDRHARYSAVGGIIPLPLVNFAGVTAVIVRMVKALSGHYGVPFERDRARAIVVGLVAGAMPTGLGAVASSTLLYLVPGAGFAGLAVSSLTAAAGTRSIGRIFVEHFETGASLDDIRVVESQKAPRSTAT